MSTRVTALALVLLAVPACAGDGDDVDSSGDAIVNGGVANGEHPEVAMLSLVDASGKGWVCTGTFVGRRTVLTARHCFEGGVIREGGACTGFVTVDATGSGAARGVRYPFDRCVVPDLGKEGRSNDMAFVRIAQPASGIVPARIAHEPPREPLYTVYGYGGFGAARGGKCAEESDADNKRRVTYRGPLGWHFARFVCPGDSGGPHFVAGTDLVAGLSSTATAFGMDIEAVAYKYADVLEAHVAQLERE